MTVGGGDIGNDVSKMFIHHTGVKLEVNKLHVDTSGLISAKGLSRETRGNPHPYYENYGGQITEMTMDKIKNILGPVHFEKYEKEELDFS